MKNFENATIRNRHGQEFDFEFVRDRMAHNVTFWYHKELESSSAQEYYDKYCKLHKEIYGKDFFVEDEELVVSNCHGRPIEFEDAIEYMDDDIREYLHHQLAPCSAQCFYDEYCKMHKEVHDEEFFTEEENVVW